MSIALCLRLSVESNIRLISSLEKNFDKQGHFFLFYGIELS